MPKRKKPRIAPASRQQRRGQAGSKKLITRRTKSPLRTGLPAPDAIVSEETLKSPIGKVYRILKTNERDAYDEAETATGQGEGNRE